MLATDEEAYKTFEDLFKPVIQELHPKCDYRYSYKFDELNSDSLDEILTSVESLEHKLKNVKLVARRNFKDTQFAPLMQKEVKLQVERKVVEILGGLYGNFTRIENLEESDKEWLEQKAGG